MKIGGPTTNMSCSAIPPNSAAASGVVATKSGRGVRIVRWLVFAFFAAMQASVVPVLFVNQGGLPFVAARCRFKHAQNDPILLTVCEARCLNHNSKDKSLVGLLTVPLMHIVLL
ncbi:hypothetical protein QE152_g8861 [Popillia japonica]|uniref:Uncharacterized protein n=1 Tax=Popillia japonica TaxID=7064 RepID=A0AAW1LWJ9_POPJA